MGLNNTQSFKFEVCRHWLTAAPLQSAWEPKAKTNFRSSVLSLTLHPLAGYILDDKGHSAASQGHGALNEHRECFVRWRTLGRVDV